MEIIIIERKTMIPFEYSQKILHCESANLQDIAEQFGTPLYVYSKNGILSAYQQIDNAFSDIEHVTCYALKANSNPHILKLLVDAGAGADVVSGGELHMALKAGFHPQKIVYASVGKTDAEIKLAIETGISALNVESQQELEITASIAAELSKKAPIAIRLNPDVDIEGHPYITTGLNVNKFGIEIDRARECYQWGAAHENLQMVGIHSHIGSNISKATPYSKTAQVLTDFAADMNNQGIKLQHIDIGGGLGVDYTKVLKSHGSPFSFSPEDLANAVVPIIKKINCELYFEPGRSILGPNGILIARVLFTKDIKGKSFIIVDAGMNDLIRPALYSAIHQILPVNNRQRPQILADIVGPICESGDFLAKDRELPKLERGDLIAVMTTGAYGYSLSSNYNGRPRAAEVLVENSNATLIRKREEL
jgi:diaminopimelate decarboxylase